MVPFDFFFNRIKHKFVNKKKGLYWEIGFELDTRIGRSIYFSNLLEE